MQKILMQNLKQIAVPVEMMQARDLVVQSVLRGYPKEDDHSIIRCCTESHSIGSNVNYFLPNLY